MVQSNLGAVEYAVCFGERLDIFGGKVVSLEGYDIDTARSSWYTVDQHVGWDVM